MTVICIVTNLYVLYCLIRSTTYILPTIGYVGTKYHTAERYVGTGTYNLLQSGLEPIYQGYGSSVQTGLYYVLGR